MAKRKAIDIYKETRIKTASKAQLIVILYDAAIRFMNTAVVNIEQKSYNQANINILKAQNVITELLSALNVDSGDEISNNLFLLYKFFKDQLLDANRTKDHEKIKSIIIQMKELREAWDKISTNETKIVNINSRESISVIC